MIQREFDSRDRDALRDGRLSHTGSDSMYPLLGRIDRDGRQESPPWRRVRGSPIRGIDEDDHTHSSTLHGRDWHLSAELGSSSRDISEWPYMPEDLRPSSRAMPDWPFMRGQRRPSSRDSPVWPYMSGEHRLSTREMPLVPSQVTSHALLPLDLSRDFSAITATATSAFGLQGGFTGGRHMPEDLLITDSTNDRSENHLATLYPSRKRRATEDPLISSMNDTFERQLSAFSSSTGMKDMGDIHESHKEEIPFDSHAMLVARQITLEDGSVRTFYSLPRESTSNFLQDPTDHSLSGKLLPPYVDLLTSGGADSTQRRGRSLAATNLQEESIEDGFRARMRSYTELTEEYLRPFQPFEPELMKRGDLRPDNDLHERRIVGLRRPDDGQFERRLQRELHELTHGIQFANMAYGERSGSLILPRGFPGYPADERRRMGFNDLDDHFFRWHIDGGALVDKSTFQYERPNLPEDSLELEKQVYRAFMNYAKALNENSEQRSKLEKQGKAGTLLCLTCNRFSKPYSDTHSLVMHTFMSRKRSLRAEHLGLQQAICTVMGWSTTLVPGIGKTYQQITAEEAKANKEDLILWPPAVVVHNALARESSNFPGVATELAVRDLLKDVGLSYAGSTVVVGNWGSLIIEYTATFSSLLEADQLHQHFASKGCGREGWMHKQMSENEDPLLALNDGKFSLQRRVLYGYLACAHDLEMVDMDFRQRCSVISRKKIGPIAGNSLA